MRIPSTLLAFFLIYGAYVPAVIAQTPAPAPTAVTAPTPPVPALSESLSIRVEAHMLRLQLAEARLAVAQRDAQIAQLNLTEERARLVEMLNADHPGYTFDWSTGTLVRAETPGNK